MTHSAVNVQPASTNSQFMPQEPTSHQETDILADILPPSGPSPTVTTQTGFSALAGEPGEPTASIYGSCNSQAGSVAPIAPNVAPNMSPHPAQFNSGNFLTHGGSTAPFLQTWLHKLRLDQGHNLTMEIYFHSKFLWPQLAHPVLTILQVDQLHSITMETFSHKGSASPAVSQAAHYATGATPQFNDGNFLPQQGSTALVGLQVAHQTATGATPQFNNGNLMPQQGSAAPVVSQVGYQAPAVPAAQHNSDLFSQGSNTPMASQTAPPSSTGSLAIVPQSSKDKFETKSAVWADTLNRGLVNLNISGPKINPLADIGIDFDAINRKEKRMEKPTTAAVTSTVTMGKAMGSGSGIGRAGGRMQSPGSAMPGGYNPMMGTGGYTQQPYGGGYR
ncbi:hypothetical protein GH714_009270 [Hevea brasiliensis]|uniref:Uncharacterized protein n=1 Tax=Hevea brasiliensis TaxID=3981 RepID=A0A6A6LGI6_HEVBR|nr:hypothetical protein GH714_009270 [Hevea brasiliensis]